MPGASRWLDAMAGAATARARIRAVNNRAGTDLSLTLMNFLLHLILTEPSAAWMSGGKQGQCAHERDEPHWPPPQRPRRRRPPSPPPAARSDEICRRVGAHRDRRHAGPGL